jgi:hypothetical protein
MREHSCWQKHVCEGRNVLGDGHPYVKLVYVASCLLCCGEPGGLEKLPVKNFSVKPHVMTQTVGENGILREVSEGTGLSRGCHANGRRAVGSILPSRWRVEAR